MNSRQYGVLSKLLVQLLGQACKLTFLTTVKLKFDCTIFQNVSFFVQSHGELTQALRVLIAQWPNIHVHACVIYNVIIQITFCSTSNGNVLLFSTMVEDLEMSASHFRSGSRRLQRKLWWQNFRVSQR